jgi:hypothetical protein
MFGATAGVIVNPGLYPHMLQVDMGDFPSADHANIGDAALPRRSLPACHLLFL